MSWDRQPLGSICDIVSGITKDSKKQGDDYREVPYLRVANVQRLRLDLSEVKTIPARESAIASYRLEPGDILLNEGGDRDKLGRGWIWQGQISECIHQNHVFRARIRDGQALPKWIAYFANTNEARAYFLATAKQTTNLASISKKNLSALPVPLPPVEVQEAIVAKIDTQLSLVDETVATLQAIQAKLKQARASILKAAVEGRLVETEAELEGTSADAISSAATLMTQISIHRNHKLKDAGKSIRPRKSIRAPLMLKDNERLNPPGWVRATVDSLCWDSDYGTSAKCTYENQGCPVLRIPNIAEGKLDLVDIKRASESTEFKSTSILQPGDFLFIRTNGSLDVIGRGCVIQNELKERTSFASYLIRLRLLGDGDLWRWFSLVWSSHLIRKSILSVCKSSAGQNNISLSTVKGFEIPVPPTYDIRRILREVDRRLSVLDQVEATVNASLRRCGQLRQAVLKRAFGG